MNKDIKRLGIIILISYLITAIVGLTSCKSRSGNFKSNKGILFDNNDTVIATPITLIKYKVRELERNTVFMIYEDNNYANHDTVWVNMHTLKVDPRDSVAMMCVIEARYLDGY